MQCRTVVHSPADLHLHPALLELDGLDGVDRVNEVDRASHHATTPILVSSQGTILSGFGRWRSALLHGEPEVQCIEYELGQEDALQFILTNHNSQRGWNAFIRTCLALTLEPHFQRGARDNMRDGGKYKGSADLPTHQHIDVRRQIAEIAGVGARNVSNVKIILAAAHPHLVTALANGTLTINKALMLCKLPLVHQLEAFSQLIEDRAIDKVIRRCLGSNQEQKTNLNPASLIAAFQSCESRHPGSLVVMRFPSGRTTISVSNDLLDQIGPQTELQLHETKRST